MTIFTSGKRQQVSNGRRRGAVSVEFAVVAPMFLVLLLGVIEMGRAFEVTQILAAAAREGARFGAMDKTGIVGPDASANAKVEQDIRNFLTAAGLDGNQADISITAEPETAGTQSTGSFDLGDPENQFKLYRITVSLPYDSAATFPATYLKGNDISISVVFRAARSTLVN